LKILVTGAAGFIGYHLIKTLATQSHTIIGLDNINDYYDVALKRARIGKLGIAKSLHLSADNAYEGNHGFVFYKTDITNTIFIKQLFKEHSFDVVVHLAAQAGVRYSITHPDQYIKSNIDGFYNILSCCKEEKIGHFMYASSSSVYGNTKEGPFTILSATDEPISLYAATKKTNELLAHSYSHLYNLKTTGLRFFTVYGPWGRPDMAYYKFANAIRQGNAIPVYNHGNLERDFTYIDDIIQGINLIISKGFIANTQNKNYAIYNIGNGLPVKLMDFIRILEEQLGQKAALKMLPMQDGDVYRTWADISELKTNYDYTPTTQITVGIDHFVKWYTKYQENLKDSNNLN
jgi:UDP-glucuronate 4-epimerase